MPRGILPQPHSSTISSSHWAEPLSFAFSYHPCRDTGAVDSGIVRGVVARNQGAEGVGAILSMPPSSLIQCSPVQHTETWQSSPIAAVPAEQTWVKRERFIRCFRVREAGS